MSYTPMYRTQTGPAWTPTLVDDDGNPVPLAGATAFTLTIKNVNSLTDRTGGGSVQIMNASAGQISYTWGASDTAIVGSFTLQFRWLDANGKLTFSDPVPWQVKDI